MSKTRKTSAPRQAKQAPAAPPGAGTALGALELDVVERLAAIVAAHGLAEISISTPSIDVALRRGVAGPAPAPSTTIAAAVAAPVATVAAVPAAAVAPAAFASAGEPAAEPAAAPNGQYATVSSPFVGTFYRSPSPDAPPYIDVGQRVKKGQVLCIVEAMKLMNEIEAEADGVVVSCLVENAQPVEYGQALFKLSPG